MNCSIKEEENIINSKPTFSEFPEKKSLKLKIKLSNDNFEVPTTKNIINNEPLKLNDSIKFNFFNQKI